MITYRTAGAWGSGAGVDLTPAQVDNNFWTLSSRIDALVLPTPVGISGFAVTGNAFTVTLSDATVLGPYALPTSQWTWRGTWAASPAYSVNDTFGQNGSVYLVLVAHVSAATFSAGANDGAGHDYYSLLLTAPGNVLPAGGAINQLLAKSSAADFALQWVNAPPAPNGVPTGGATGQLLAKTSATNYDLEWIPAPTGVPAGGAAGYTLTKASAADYDVGWAPPPAAALFAPTLSVPPQTNDGLRYDAFYGWINAPIALAYTSLSGSATLASSYAGAFVEVNSASAAVVITIPENATVAFEVNTEIVFQQTSGSNPVSFVAASGVTLVYDPTCLPQLVRAMSRAVLKQVSVDSWFLYGDLSPAMGNLGATSGAVAINVPFPRANFNAAFEVTPTGDMTITASSQLADQRTFVVTASGTTSHTITFGTGFRPAGTLATGTISGKVFTVTFIGDGATYYETARTGPL